MLKPETYDIERERNIAMASELRQQREKAELKERIQLKVPSGATTTS
jgi:hypothetical protein